MLKEKIKNKFKRTHRTDDELRAYKKRRKLHIIYTLIICNIVIFANSYVMYSKWSDHYKELLARSVTEITRVSGVEAMEDLSISDISREYTCCH